MKLKALFLSAVLAVTGALVPGAALAVAPTPPAGPVFNQVQLKALADNDFAVFMGNDTEITRLFYQNMVSWPDQVNNIQTLDVYPESGETYIYIVPMGGNSNYYQDNGGAEGGGEEDWNGVLNGIPLLDYPGAEVAVGRRIADSRDVLQYGYLLIHKYLTGFQSSAGAIAGGWFDATLADMRTASQNLTWAPALRNNHPSRIIIKNSCSVSCSGSRFNPAIPNGAWNFPDASAALFRYPLSNANLPVSPGDRQVTVTWKDPQAGGAVDNYLVEFKESSQPDSTFKVFGTVPGTARTSTVTGLTNGTAYTLRVTANNSAGSASSYGRSVVPTGTPSRPANQSYSAGTGQVSINFSPPENDGGMAVTNYAYSTDDGATWITRSPASTASPITISGLTDGSTYSVRLRAINPFGAGQISLPIVVKPGIVSTRTLTYESGTLAPVQNLPAGDTLVAGSTFTVASGPTRTNFTFTGWKDGNTAYSPGDTYTVGATNPTLTAQWVQNSLLGVTPGSRSKVLTWNIVDGESIDLTVAAGTDNSVRIQIPAGAFAAGTEVVFWRLVDDQLAKARINSARDYFVNLAVTWSKGDDVNTPKIVADAAIPVVLTLMNPTIQAGATAWQIIGETTREVGTAVRAGELVLRFTEDPVITAANVPPTAQFSVPVSTADGYTVNITNYDANITWEPPTISAGTVAILGTSGSVRSLAVTGLTAGQSATISQRTLLSGVYQTGTVTGSAAVPAPPASSGGSSSPAPTPTPTPTPTVETKPVEPAPVVVAQPAPKPKRTKSVVITGFAGGSSVLTQSAKRRLEALLKQVPVAESISCVGNTMGPTVLKVDSDLARRRATAVCGYLDAKLANAKTAKVIGKTTTINNGKLRRVAVTVVY